jgi:orotidine-5'-phosphate decarboxylase
VPVPDSVRDKLALALDVDDLVAAQRLVKQVGEWFGTVKVGMELFYAEGPETLVAFRDSGFRVFADLKLFDIPTTVRRAAQVVGGLGASYLTVHAAGGADVLAAAAEGLDAGASAAGAGTPTALAVTVLTSDATAPPEVVPRRAALAAEAGCRGVVCSVGDLAAVRAAAPGLFAVTPGIRLRGGDAHDQARAATPEAAIAAGADLLVIGRAVTAAPDPAAAAAAIADAISG